MKNYVQRFGKFLSAMVMPNIGALIAFGFLAALFIDSGWIPNEGFNSLVSPMLTYLIPILIASTGGRMIGGDRGRVVGAIAVIGAIMSNTSITMLMAAMILGPLAGFCIKKFDQVMEGHMPAGFEMLLVASGRVLSAVEGSGVLAVAMPLSAYDLVGTLSMMQRERSRRRKKEKQKPKPRSKEERAVIENAKALLMERNHMTESEAHRYIQKCSMDSGTNLVETAQMILALMSC